MSEAIVMHDREGIIWYFQTRDETSRFWADAIDSSTFGREYRVTMWDYGKPSGERLVCNEFHATKEQAKEAARKWCETHQNPISGVVYE